MLLFRPDDLTKLVHLVPAADPDEQPWTPADERRELQASLHLPMPARQCGPRTEPSGADERWLRRRRPDRGRRRQRGVRRRRLARRPIGRSARRGPRRPRTVPPGSRATCSTSFAAPLHETRRDVARAPRRRRRRAGAHADRDARARHRRDRSPLRRHRHRGVLRRRTPGGRHRRFRAPGDGRRRDQQLRPGRRSRPDRRRSTSARSATTAPRARSGTTRTPPTVARTHANDTRQASGRRRRACSASNSARCSANSPDVRSTSSRIHRVASWSTSSCSTWYHAERPDASADRHGGHAVVSARGRATRHRRRRRSGEHRSGKAVARRGRRPVRRDPEPEQSARSRQLSERSPLIGDIQRRGVPDHIDFTSIGATEDWVVPATNISLRGAHVTTVAVASPSLGEHHDDRARPERAPRGARGARGPRAAVRRPRRPRCAARSRPWSSAAPRISSATQRPANFREEPHEARVFVFALVMAAVLAVPTPARPATSKWSAAIWSSALTGGPWGLTTDGRGAVVVTRRRPGARPRLRRHHAMGGEGRRRARRATRRSASDLVLVGATGRVVALGRRDGAVRWQQPMDGDVACGRTGRRVRARRRHRWHAPGVRRDEWSRSCGRPTTRASSGRRRRSTLPPRSSSRSGTKNRHPPLAPSTSPPVRCAGSTRSGCTPPRPGWITGAPSSRPATGTTTRGLPRSISMPESPSGPSRCPRRSRRASCPQSTAAISWWSIISAESPRSIRWRARVRWTRALNRNVIDTRVVLFAATRGGHHARRAELFVLDRVSGRVVAHADGRDFDGIPVLAAPARRPNRMLVTIRLTQPGRVEMRRVP